MPTYHVRAACSCDGPVHPPSAAETPALPNARARRRPRFGTCGSWPVSSCSRPSRAAPPAATPAAACDPPPLLSCLGFPACQCGVPQGCPLSPLAFLELSRKRLRD
eukprot:scaffold743_cov106-Isochrysis_galbana.AAC.1